MLNKRDVKSKSQIRWHQLEQQIMGLRFGDGVVDKADSLRNPKDVSVDGNHRQSKAEAEDDGRRLRPNTREAHQPFAPFQEVHFSEVLKRIRSVSTLDLSETSNDASSFLLGEPRRSNERNDSLRFRLGQVIPFRKRCSETRKGRKTGRIRRMLAQYAADELFDRVESTDESRRSVHRLESIDQVGDEPHPNLRGHANRLHGVENTQVNPFLPRLTTFPLLLAVLLALTGCGANTLVGRWKVEGQSISGIEEFDENGRFEATLGYMTPVGEIKAAVKGDYSSTNTTVTTSVTDLEIDPKSLPAPILDRATERVKRMAFVTQVIQIKWISRDTIQATAPDGRKFKLQRLK